MKRPGLMREIFVLCSERLTDMQDLRCMGQEPVPVRIAATLLRLYQSHGKTIPLAKWEIAELVGAAVETAFRAMSDLQRKGILTSRYGRVPLEKPEELRKIIGNS